MSGRNSFFDLPPKPSSPPYREAELLLKTEPVSPMGDQPGVPNLNEGEEDAAANAYPNAKNINADDIPANNQNMAPRGVQGGQLSTITLFSGTKGLEALTYDEAFDGSLAQFGWTQAQAAQAAISRGGHAVANWIRGEQAAGITYIPHGLRLIMDNDL